MVVKKVDTPTDDSVLEEDDDDDDDDENEHDRFKMR